MENSAETKTKRGLMMPLLIGAVIISVLAFFGVRAWRLAQEEARQAQIEEDQALAQARIEDEWGIRVTQVAATADGGLVDLRYRITDPDKAIYLYDEVQNIPRLVTEDGGVEIGLTTLPHQHDLEFGQSYFIIFRNIAGAVKPGGRVTVYVGDIGLKHFEVAR
jgi:hypothetical protein